MTDIIIIIWLHWLADFVLQSDKMALNKSDNVFALLRHSLVYTFCLLIVGWEFAVINGALHFLIDGITSRITKRFYQNENRYGFFVTIGLDQALHLSILVWSFYWLNN